MTDGDTTAQSPPYQEPAWEDPPRRSRPDAAPVLSVDGFEGPLDSLVEQVRAGRIDLARLSIAALVEAFSGALQDVVAGADKRPAVLARWSAWLVMAADLALLRSRLLLPADAAQDRTVGTAADDLRRQVLQRAGIAAAADWLEGRRQIGRNVWGRGQQEAIGDAGRAGHVTALLRACLVALRVRDDVEAAFRVAVPVWSVADAVARIQALLPALESAGAPLQRFLPEVPWDAPDYDRRCRAAVASTFAAGLDLVRDGVLGVEQPAALATSLWAQRRGS